MFCHAASAAPPQGSRWHTVGCAALLADQAESSLCSDDRYIPLPCAPLVSNQGMLSITHPAVRSVTGTNPACAAVSGGLNIRSVRTSQNEPHELAMHPEHPTCRQKKSLTASSQPSRVPDAAASRFKCVRLVGVYMSCPGSRGAHVLNQTRPPPDTITRLSGLLKPAGQKTCATSRVHSLFAASGQPLFLTGPAAPCDLCCHPCVRA